MKYISKGQWFDKGTEVELIVMYDEVMGLFSGLRNGKIDEEDCSLDEFENVE